MKQKNSIPVVIAVLLIAVGIVNIFLWQSKELSIYGLVFGVFAFILAAFVFHFRKPK